MPMNIKELQERLSRAIPSSDASAATATVLAAASMSASGLPIYEGDDAAILALDKEVELNPADKEAASLLSRLRLLTAVGFYQQLNAIAASETRRKDMQKDIFENLVAIRKEFLSADLDKSDEEELRSQLKEKRARIATDNQLILQNDGLVINLPATTFASIKGPRAQIDKFLEDKANNEQALFNLVEWIGSNMGSTGYSSEIVILKQYIGLKKAEKEHPASYYEQCDFLSNYLNALKELHEHRPDSALPLFKQIKAEKGIFIAHRSLVSYYLQGKLKVDSALIAGSCGIILESKSNGDRKAYYQQLQNRLLLLASIKFDEQFDLMKNKAKQLESRGKGSTTAAKDANQLCMALMQAKMNFLRTGKVDNPDTLKKTFVEACEAVVDTAAKSSLKDHRGWGDTLAWFLNLLVRAVTFWQCNPRGTLIKENKFGFFRPQTHSAQLVASLSFKEPEPALAS